MNLHLASLSDESMRAYADIPQGRVYVAVGAHRALLAMSPDEARALATGLLNAAVEMEAQLEVAA